ncbi:MAG: hypothetical protein M5U31_13710 [Acidimicrobiia bacterium]|nr:hypothetical protein [Acidimicrobiia bacterium]
MRHVRWLLVATVALVVLAGCGPIGPGEPGTGQRNTFLEITGRQFADGLDIEVVLDAEGGSPGRRCYLNGTFVEGTYDVRDGRSTVCYSFDLPTWDVHRASKLMQGIGRVYAHRLVQVGSTWRQGPITDVDKFADCFAQYHGANPAFNNDWGGQSCPQSWRDKIGQMEAFAFPANTNPKWFYRVR